MEESLIDQQMSLPLLLCTSHPDDSIDYISFSHKFCIHIEKKYKYCHEERKKCNVDDDDVE